ncbi:MAG TPA: glycosyltransferase family 4 protein [Chloroflexota bacterium]|jgi:glycosyltransferase involved in cell wall biosynthesis|nr:glycosyltransferase family 4 protein [Chloroflexota bacterium]
MTYHVLAIAPTSFFADYGCHVRILEEARALARRGHRVTICTYHTGRTPPDLPPGVHVVRMPRLPWYSEVRVGSHYHKFYLDALLALRSVLAARGRIDVVHAHMHDGALIGYLVSRLRRVPLLFDYQGSLTREMVDHQFLRTDGPFIGPVRWLEQMIDRLPDAIVTSSTNAATSLQAHLAPGRPAVQTLLDAVDVGTFVPPPAGEVAALRARLGIPAGRQVVGFIGLLAEYQGVGHLIYAARRIVERRPNTHFLIMGYPGLERYRRQAYDLQIMDSVTFTGRVPYETVPHHLALADVAVSAKLSASEANGKLLNYMAMGLPTVVYDTPVAREILDDLGVYAPAGDVAGLAEAIQGLLDDPDRRRSLGLALRRRAERCFSWDAVAERLEGLYTALRQGRKTGKLMVSGRGLYT